MPAIQHERLQRLLGDPALARLLERLRRRFEAGGCTRGALTLADAGDQERQAIERLMGRAPGRGTSLQIRLEALERVIQATGAAPDLVSAVAALVGPMRDRHADRSREQAAWQAVFDAVRERTSALGLGAWLVDLQASGLLKRLARQDPDRARRLLDQALRVAAALPGRGQPLSTLAAVSLGDAHALDRGRPLATLTKRAAAVLGHSDGEADSPESDREVWASVGVLVGGALTSIALVLNLPADTTTVTGRSLALLSEEGQPGCLTLRQLVRDPGAWGCRGKRVYVCENPAVIAEAAEALGSSCAPLVCTNGQPGAAVATLLRQLAEAGAELAYHGDFDWPGIGIGNVIMSRFGARHWRFDAAAYQAVRRDGRPLSGTPLAACWDEALMPAMLGRDRQLEEEQVLDGLLDDLQRRGG